MSTISLFSRRTHNEFPNWSRRSARALPAISGPRLSPEERASLGNERRLGMVLIARVIVAIALFVGGALAGWWVLAVVSTWLVYGSALTAVHHLIHGSMGLPPRVRRFWLSVIGILVVESGHALQVTHLLHHRGDDNLPDPEGYIENEPWHRMPIAALKFRYRLMLWGWRHSPRRRRVGFELGCHALVHLGSLALLPLTPIPWIYVSLIHVASFGFAVLAGKGPQTNWGRAIDSPFVRVRSRLAWIVFFSHDRHLEHHVYPKVPLPFLRRLDERVASALDGKHIVDIDLAI